MKSTRPVPATWWNSLSVRPGHSACTTTPEPFSSPASASVNESTKALLAA